MCIIGIGALLSVAVSACTSSALDEVAEGVTRLHRIELASPLLLHGALR